MSERLIDLDELVLRCQDKTTKDYIKEAVSCYRAGAFRSCIVSTWNAVVFDFIHKLGELKLTGDGQARDELDSFETYRSAEEFKKMWEFESNIPQLAQEKYEFISSIERQDLERLHEDRSLCAHPSMHSMGEPFHPTPELARCHLRNAITHLLQHPPVQGKTALKHIWATIESEYFPEDEEQAFESLKTYLSRARKSLINSVVIGLTKGLLLDEKPAKENNRMFASLVAVKKLYFNEVASIINKKLSNIVDSVPDQKWHRVFFYIRRMDACEALNSAQKLKAKNYIEAITEINLRHAYVLLNSLNIQQLEQIANSKIKEFKDEELTLLIEIINQHRKKIKYDNIIGVIKDYEPYIVQKFITSKQFWSAANYGHKLLYVSEYLEEKEIKAVLEAFCNNYEIYGAEKEVPEIMTDFFNQTIHLVNSVESEWLLVREKIKERYVYTELLDLIDKQFPQSTE